MRKSHLNESADQTCPKRCDVKLPYFDLLFKLFRDGEHEVEKSFGRHVHWGLWDDPGGATLTAEDFANATENLSRRLCRSAGIGHGLSILDVGCGFGGTLAHIDENFFDMELVGLNIDERQLLRARSVTCPKPGNRIDFIRGNACSLPFSDESFDIVLAVECIFHFPDRESFFREAFRVLKPGGRLALSDFIPSRVLLPLIRTRTFLTNRFSTGFYGLCDLQISEGRYRQIAEKTRFSLLVNEDVTEHTLPTYTYIKKLAKGTRIKETAAILETASVEWASRFKLLGYHLLAWQKI